MTPTYRARVAPGCQPSRAELNRLRRARGLPAYGAIDQPKRSEPKPSPKGRATTCAGCGKAMLSIATKVKPECTTCRRSRLEDARPKALVLRENGWTIRDISRTLKVSESTVCNWVAP